MSYTQSFFEAGIQQAHQFFKQGRKLDAANALEAVGELAGTAKELRRLAIHFNELNLPQSALVYLLKAVKLQDRDADLLNSLALTYWALGEYEKAESFTQRALRIAPMNPLFHANLALAQLHLGRYTQAWPHFRQRHLVIAYRRDWAAEHRTWRGEMLTSETLLLYCSQGIGDIFLLTRYLPLVRPRARHIILEVDETCFTLYQNCPWVDEVRIRNDQTPPECDVHCELFDLPMVFATTINTIPPVQPLAVEEDPGIASELAGHRQRNPGWKHVGLVWSGHVVQTVNPRRACGIEQILPLLELRSMQFYSLQKGEPGAGLARFGERSARLVDLAPMLTDFRATATAISKLDLVITVDTAVANLAGMLGKTVWVLLHDNPEWRWGREDQSPWYPSARMFRQTSPGDWADVMRRVRAELLGSLIDF